MMLGAVNMGKTTTATRLAGAAVLAGLSTAVVDADTGQSDLGPPATVGWGMIPHPVRHMADIPPEGLWFIGDTSPRRLYRYVVEGTVALAARARRRGAQVVVVDTTGWVEGADAVAAKVRKIRLLAPRHIVAIQREREVEPILSRVPEAAVVHRLRPGPAVRVRSALERRALRERRFAAYFATAKPLVIDTRRITLRRSALFRDASVPPSRVLAEVPPDALRHLLVGLADRRGTIMAMGTVTRAEPELGRLSVLAPDVVPGAVRSMLWGVLRVAPTGREDGRLSDMPEAAP